ncbi:MAG TPA: PAS domain S-box protein [Spirochaetota bacterium]|nr:PAS domain S-box protein [Spirochaetota bacterium]
MSEIKQRTILLVDDEPLLAAAEKRQLEGEGYRVIMALSGEEAIEIMASGKEAPDLILMDIDMGSGMDGTETAAEILKEHDIPVVFLSSYIEKEIVKKTEKISSYGYVVKNSGIVVLDASIKMAFRLFESRIKEKEKAAALQESREIFRNLSDRAIVGIYFIQDDRFLYANSTLAEILGYGISELVHKMGPEDVIYNEDWPLVRDNIRSRISGEQESNRYEFRIRTREGELRDVEIYSARTIFNGKPAVIGTLVDITERKSAEDELKKINERFRLITENMSEGVVLSDLNMRLVYVTPSVIKRHGYSFEELNDIPLEKRMTRESYERFIKMVSEEMAPEKLADPDLDLYRVIELEYIRKDGSTCWSESSFRLIRDSSGKPAGILGVGRDITERKQIENALIESEARFRGLSEDVPAYICTFLPDCTMTYANPALAEMAGIDSRELTGKNFLDFIVPSEKEKIEQIIRGLSPEKPTEFHEQTHLDSDGSISYQEWRNRAFFDDRGRPLRYLSVGVDITERKETEERLRAQTLAMEAAIDGIAILDADQKYKYLNRAHAETYGYENVGELIGRSWRALYGNDELLRFDNEIMPQLKNSGAYRGSAVGKKKDGSSFDQELSLTALDNGGLVCIVRDITESKRIEKSLRESEEMYRLLVDHSSDLIWNLALDGIFTYVSPSWERVTGYIPEEIVGTLFQPMVHPDDVDVCLNYLEQMSHSSVVLPGPEYRVKHADGTWHWHAATGTPVIGDDGEFISLVGVSRDITERKLADLQIRNLLKEKEVILKEVHHRIKNNMNTIFGLLALEADAHDVPEVKNVLRDSAGRVQSMMVLYDKLYRSEIKSDVSVIDYFPALIKEIVSIFPNAQDVAISTDIEDIDLAADILSPLGIIINELITNTMKYAFQGRAGGSIKMKVAREGEMITVVYQDNGIGLPGSVTCETSSGFGLQLVSMLLKQIRGNIRIERNEGARFIIDFER